MARWDKEELIFKQPDEEKIVCKDCRFRKEDVKVGEQTLSGATYGMCKVFQYKPVEVLLYGAMCDYYLSENDAGDDDDEDAEQ